MQKAHLIILVLVMLVSPLRAQAPSAGFKVLSSKGKTEYFRNKAWSKAVTGVTLAPNEKVRLGPGAEVNLVYLQNNRAYQVTKPGTYNVADLAKEAGMIAEGTVTRLATLVLREIKAPDDNGDDRTSMGLNLAVQRSEPSAVVAVQLEKGKTTKIYDQSYALVIGASNYTQGWPSLPGVETDIRIVSDALRKHGFETIVVANPDHSGLEKAFKDFINTYGMNADNRLLFYFAGHGHTLRQSYGEEMGYIIPTDAPNPNVDRSGFIAKSMAMQQLEVFAKQIQAKHALFLFDACFSGSIFSLSRAIPENISYKTAKPVRQFITSGSADETVPDQSVFREQFVSALYGEGDINRDGFVTGTELGEFLQEKVVNYSKGSQHPQYGKIRNPNLDKGDFVFALRPATGAPDVSGAEPQLSSTPNDQPTFQRSSTPVFGASKQLKDFYFSVGFGATESIYGSELQQSFDILDALGSVDRLPIAIDAPGVYYNVNDQLLAGANLTIFLDRRTVGSDFINFTHYSVGPSAIYYIKKIGDGFFARGEFGFATTTQSILIDVDGQSVSSTLSNNGLAGLAAVGWGFPIEKLGSLTLTIGYGLRSISNRVEATGQKLPNFDVSTGMFTVGLLF